MNQPELATKLLNALDAVTSVFKGHDGLSTSPLDKETKIVALQQALPKEFVERTVGTCFESNVFFHSDCRPPG